MNNFFLLLIISSIPIFVLLRYVARATLLRGREDKPLESLYQSFVFETPVDLSTFVRVISLIAKCYHIPPGKLRADDGFDGFLAKLDSWDLGNGTEDLQNRLERECSFRFPEGTRLSTVRELIEACQLRGNAPLP